MPLNRGSCPGFLRGTTKRVWVRLFNGLAPADSWPADGKGKCDWRISNPPKPFEIEAWSIDE